MSQKGLRVEFTVPRPRKRREEKPTPKDPVPRIARLLALAHKWEGMVRRGEVKDYAEIARLMGLSRSRVTQVCGLTLLAPAIQEAVLVAVWDKNSAADRILRRVTAHADWHSQQTAWPHSGN